MPGIFKKLSANDIKITSFEAHKRYSNTNLSSLGVSADFVYWSPYNKSTYTTGSIKYSQIDKLYYRDYIRKRAHRLELDDATYTTQERRLYEYANVISIPQKTFGSEVQPGTFILSCSYGSEEQFHIKDDGFGNLYDVNKGRTNFPNEDYRILYIGPTQAFKRKDLTIDYETGKEYVNNPFTNGYTRTVYDDSYFLNEVEFKNVNFVSSSNFGFFSVRPSATDSYIKTPHQPQFNFEKDDDFTINFYYDLNTIDHDNSAVDGDYFILTKEGNKTVAALPSEKTRNISLRRSGSAQIKTAPIGNQFPYRIYYKGNTPSANTASLFFERSDGETTQFVSSSFFLSGSSDTQKFISCKSQDSSLLLRINGTETVSTTQNSPRLSKTVSNKADITFYNKPNPNGSYSNFIGNEGGQISQLMIWNQALSGAEIRQVSESIIGTPNIGNIFYDNGFAVTTHPDYMHVLNNYDVSNMFSSVTSGSIAGSGNFDASRSAGIRFNPNGTKLFTCNTSNDKIITFDLDSPFDVTTINRSSSYSDFISNPMSIEFSPDGLNFYVGSYSGESITQYKLSSSFDLGSKTGITKTLDLTGTNAYTPYGMCLNNTGTRLFIVNSLGASEQISQRDLEDPYDISTVLPISSSRHVQNDLGGFITTSPDGVNFDSTGYNMFIVGVKDGGGVIAHYTLNTPFDIRSIDLSKSYSTSISDYFDYPSDIIFNNEGTKAFLITAVSQPATNAQDVIWEFNPTQNINRFEYKNTHLITENEYQCTMTEDEFEFTRNSSTRKIPFSDSEDLANFATGSNFKPYVTSVGLYDDMGNLLVVGKLGQPIKASDETDTTFVIRFDT